MDETAQSPARLKRSNARDIPYWQLLQVWNIASLDEAYRTAEGEEMLPMIHLLPSERPSVEEEAIAEERVRMLYAALAMLTPMEERIIRLRFGVGSPSTDAYYGTDRVKLDRARTLEEVGEIVGRTRERIRQIEQVALGKLAAAYRQLEQPKRRMPRHVRVAVRPI